MSKAKKYADYTAEEKAEYKAKRDAYWLKREEDAKASFSALESELRKLNVGANVLDLVTKCKQLSGVEKGVRQQSEGYLTAVFGTENPTVGQKSSYLYIGIRGKNGERLNEGETLGQLVTRTGDVSYKYSSNDISSICWYLRQRGHKVKSDKVSMTVTYEGFEKPVVATDATGPKDAPKSQLIKRS
jgi:hypothetical protein